MFKIRSITQLAAAVLASGCFALALGARAEARTDSMEMKAAGFDSAACKSAQLSAWFERERQLSDGYFVPGRIATPRECLVTPDANAAGEAAPARLLVAAAKVPNRGFPGGYEGVTLGGA
jgi:hypothetical protein